MSVARPAPVRIDDYANPCFSPDVAAIRDAVAPFAAELRLESDALIDQAVAETGVDDLGADKSFRERLDIYLGALRDEAGLAPFGVVANHALTLQLLKSRLLIEDLFRRHPEIASIRIDHPIIIVGLPRTGTTHLHNMLSADPALRSLPYWESLEPVLAPSEQPGPGEADPRIARTQVAVDMLDATMPLFKRMHEMTVEHVHEEIQLLAIDCSSMLMETTAVMPTWREYYSSHDQTPHYEFLRRVLQALTFLRGGERWVLKSPQHSEQLPVVSKVFPDATFVVTHRDPVRVSASVATMVAYSARMNVEHPDPLVYGQYWANRVEELLMACARDRDVLPEGQAIDVRFDEYMADDRGTVERIYEVAGQPLDATARAAMDSFLDRHPRGRHGTVVYDLADFGVDPADRRSALRPYSERFGIRDED